MPATLHYIYDPLCGWCYGAEPLVTAAATSPSVALELHAGALWPEPTRLPESTRLYIRQADQRIAAMSGQRFGPDYHNGLLLDPTMVLESRPPTAAVLAAQMLDPAKALPMLRAIQHAHYEQGLRVVEHDVLCDLAVEIGLDRAEFDAALKRVPLEEHIDATHRLMSHVGAQGFPTFVLQVGDDLHPVPHGRFSSQPAQFRDWLETQVKAHEAAH
ncbi:MAG TPA: DsbA family protein [Gammaproteobacteria bacterium]|nr:DsbA family protein [Gammaproteobacteria bacterium]